MSLRKINISEKELGLEKEETVYDVALFCIKNDSCSINDIQNYFGINYKRVVNIIDILEKRGIISKLDANNNRMVLIDNAKLDEIFKAIL